MSRLIQFFITTTLGITCGLIYGWKLAPVEYKDTTPDTLRADYRADYVLMVAEAYQPGQDVDLAAQRLALLGSNPPVEIALQTLSYIQQAGYSEIDLARLQNLALALQTWQPVSGGGLP